MAVAKTDGMLGGFSGTTRKHMAAEFDADELDELMKEVEEVTTFGHTDDLEEKETDLDDIDKFTSVKEVATILRSATFKKMLADIERVTAPNAPIKDTITKDDPEYELIHQAMKCCIELQTEIGKVHKFVRNKYKKYYPELEQFVIEPIQYAKAVKIVGFDFDLQAMVSKLKEASFAGTVVVKIIVTRSTSKPADNPTLAEQRYITEACDEMLSLELAKQFVLEYTQLRMNHLAPNVSAIVGTAIASQVVGIVGGLDNLTKLPADHIMLLGRTRSSSGTGKGDASLYHGSFLLNTDIVRSQEPDFRDRALKMVANKVILAARIDATRYAPDGSRGAALRERIVRQIEGIMDGSIPSGYRPGHSRKRARESQDMSILAAARQQMAQQQIAGGPSAVTPSPHVAGAMPHDYPAAQPPPQRRNRGVKML